MIQTDRFKEIQDKILSLNEKDLPSAPESLFPSIKANNQDSSFSIFLEKGGQMVKQVVAIGKGVVNSDAGRQVVDTVRTVAKSDSVAEVMKADLVKQALAGAAVGASLTMAIPFSIVGLGTGAAVGATLASWKYFTK